MFKVKASDQDEKSERVLKLKHMLDSLKMSIEALDYLETGINISTRDIAFDLVLITHFSSIENLHKYIQHPEHQKVVKYLDIIKDSTSVVDYEF